MRIKDAPSALTTSKLLVRSRSCSDTTQLVSEGLGRGTQRHIHSGPRASHSSPGTAQAGRAEARFGADAFPHAAGLQVRGVFCSFSKASSDFIVRRQTAPEDPPNTCSSTVCLPSKASAQQQATAVKFLGYQSYRDLGLRHGVGSPKPIVLKGHPCARDLRSHSHKASSPVHGAHGPPSCATKRHAQKDSHCPSTAPSRTACAEDTRWAHRLSRPHPSDRRLVRRRQNFQLLKNPTIETKEVQLLLHPFKQHQPLNKFLEVNETDYRKHKQSDAF